MAVLLLAVAVLVLFEALVVLTEAALGPLHILISTGSASRASSVASEASVRSTLVTVVALESVASLGSGWIKLVHLLHEQPHDQADGGESQQHCQPETEAVAFLEGIAKLGCHLIEICVLHLATQRGSEVDEVQQAQTAGHTAENDSDLRTDLLEHHHGRGNEQTDDENLQNQEVRGPVRFGLLALAAGLHDGLQPTKAVEVELRGHGGAEDGDGELCAIPLKETHDELQQGESAQGSCYQLMNGLCLQGAESPI